MESSSVASASSEAGSCRSQEIEELERFIDSYVLEYQVQGILTDKTEGDEESLKTQSSISQWAVNCSEQLDSSCSSTKGKVSSSTHNQNGNQDDSLDVLGTDIWEASNLESISNATWDLQPEKLDLTQVHRKVRNTPKHLLPQIDKEGTGKGKCEDGDGINLNDIEKVLPVWQNCHPAPNEVEIAHTKKLFRRRRNDRRKQQRPQGGNKPQPQQHTDHQQGTAKHSTRDHQKAYQGGQALHPSGRSGHHGYNQNRRWHHNQKHLPNDKEPHRNNAKETESVKTEDVSTCNVPLPSETHRSTEAAEKQSHSERLNIQECESKGKDSIHNRTGERPKINLLQSSKDRLRRRLKEKDDIPVEIPNPQTNKMDKLIEILNSMRNNSSGVDSKLTTFMEEAQNSANSEEMLGEIVKTIYQKAVTDRSFAATAAKLCDKMALFMVEGTKFRSLLLNMLQKDFTMREELRQTDVERWLGFITFLCEVFGTMKSSTGEPFRVLVCPIYTCLRELLQSQDVKEDAVLCCSMELQSAGRLLEEQLPEMMTELLAAARDKMLCPSESMLTRSLLLEVIELHANNWNPLLPTITQYYNRTIQKLTA
uniref:CBP80/20-dependent translation initiation factor n=1 Tax=Geotrypetes seraphini TaxID=260995 RepID=A0A6P8QVR5_GEOSA|nr:CBP80/20-dependent translation initiation factor [Geotrypetes seraphini]XP_033790641.1 CBP80/20-dependent translation initiation factor [Geotrypetes seraphini]